MTKKGQRRKGEKDKKGSDGGGLELFFPSALFLRFQSDSCIPYQKPGALLNQSRQTNKTRRKHLFCPHFFAHLYARLVALKVISDVIYTLLFCCRRVAVVVVI